MAPGHGKPLRRSSRERRPPPSPPSATLRKSGRSSKIVVNRKSSLANNASSVESATESGSDSQESSSSEQSFSNRRAASASSDDVPLSCSVPDRMGKTRRKAAADDDVVMEVADVGEAPASGARETRKTEKRKKKPKVNLKAPEPPAKPKSLSQVAADRSESPVASTSQSVEIPPDYHRVDLNTYAFQGEFGWADIRFPISYDESTVLPRFAYIREYTVESACEYMRVHRRDHPDFLRRPGCSDADFAHQGFLLMEPGSSLFPEGKSIAAVLLRFNGFKIAHQSILYRLPAIKPPPPFPEDPSHPFFYDPDDPEPPEPSTDTKPFPPFEDKACYTLAERSAKKAEWRNLVTAHNASEAERVRLAVDVYDTKHAEWASRASVRIEKARARDQYEIEAISTYNRKRQETFDEFSSALHTAGAYLVFLITDDLRRSRLADIKDTSTTAESGPSWRPKRGRAPLELHPAIESLSETDLPKSVLDEVLGPNGFKEDLSKYDLQTLVTILRVMKIQGVMIGEARSQTYISMYMGSENEYDPDAWHKDNSPFDPNAGTGHRVRGWSVDAESSGYIEGFVQDELIPAVIARRMCFTRGMGCIECLFGMIPCIRVMHGDSPVAGSCIHCRAKKNKCIMTPGPYCFAITDRILALFNEHWVLFVILESLRDQHRLTGGGLAESILSLLFRWIQATRGMDAAALARRSFYDLIAQGPSSVPSGEPIPALPTGLAEAFKPVVGGLGIGDEDVVEEATETAADVKGKGKRRAEDEVPGNLAKRRPHRETSVPVIVAVQDQDMDGADSGGERVVPTSPAEPPPSTSGYPTTRESSPPANTMPLTAPTSPPGSRIHTPRARTPSADPSFSSLSGALDIFGGGRLAVPAYSSRGSAPPPPSSAPAAAELFNDDTSVELPEVPSGEVSGGGGVPPSADAMDTDS
ncbi:hypothetical protein DFH06DRAFT_1352265 [Mycena polygramma]|nr:hypothetical protein DFH06DRAFT_1352265 [Mycena polygramma]